MDADIFDGAADFKPPSKYKAALVRIGVELDELPPLPTVQPKIVDDLKKAKKDELVKAYQSLQAAYIALVEYTSTIRPALEVVRDTAEETLLQ